jgi:predicted transcriptional regulator
MAPAANSRKSIVFTVNLLIAAAIAGSCQDDGPDLFLLLPLSMLMYTKLVHDKILDNFVRGKLFGFIQANPGEDCTTLMLNLDLPHGTLLYHLGRLEREELVTSRADGLHKRYYPANTSIPEPGPSRLTGSQETVYGLICGEPGISQIDMANKLGVSTVAVTYHLDALLEKEVISRKRIGLRYRYYPSGSGQASDVELDPFVTPPA